MLCKEVLEVITCVAECSPKQADNYWDHCRAVIGKFNLLVRGGKVCSTQKTITNCMQVTMEQQLQ